MTYPSIASRSTLGAALLGGVVGGLLAAAVTWISIGSDPSAGLAYETGSPDPEQFENAPQIRGLEARIERLSSQVATLRANESRGTFPAVVDGSMPTSPEAVSGGDEFDPRRYLDLYVRSFDHDPKGSEYFRLAVDAWAVQLLAEIGRVLADTHQPIALRLRLVQMLGTPRFTGLTVAIDALLDGVRSGPEKLSTAALASLATAGTSATVEALESEFPALGPNAKKVALQTMAKLAGPKADEVFLRLLRGAPDQATCTAIVLAISSANPDVTLEVLRYAFHRDVPERTAAATRLNSLFGKPYEELIESQLRIERDPGVRRLLQSARQKVRTVPAHHPMQATGAPNSDPARDDQRSWATATSDGGREWLEVGFARSMRASSIRIHENHVAGAVIEVVAIDDRGGRHRLWHGEDPTTRPGPFAVPMAPTSYAVRRIHITLDTSLKKGWNEIDAVQLIGPDGSAWASTARASSYFGSGSSRRLRMR